ncbi:hypothetical protein AMAG_11169 [Allomyces macrogynus ATCC 38327]|uniref:Golgi apparatus membrane protein TVP23 n=1 Tax=Allomyces macrogynus (strain ATCC 38327) TaxID=578462 RepID=A0A0L0SSV0_ALLM3|nr:hypothetical protein AMAG_11169 [Allomyces macrogynus ATCC 38327]|eukprot:KNE65556.1 hypothetical protein AMAG_11169 [Allomyces macrogynus ATCC 38327]
METRINMTGAANPAAHFASPTVSGSMQPIAAQSGAAVTPERNKTMFEKSSHPVALLFHLLFRVAALTTYLIGYYVTENFILIFVVCVLLLAFDFWTVKNVTGRLLVGLRWWNDVREDGTSQWVFESRENNSPNPADSYVFWTTLYAFPAAWAVFAILQLLHPAWLCLTVVAVALNMANVIGYTKCDKDAKKRLAGYGQSVLSSGVGQSVVSGILSRGTGGLLRGFMGGGSGAARG